MDLPQMLTGAGDTHEGDAAGRLAGWTPEQQIAHMLQLCEAQMESALSESDLAVEQLVQSFAAVIEAGQALTVANDQQSSQAGAGNLSQHLEAMKRQTAAAIVAFQFYDKLTQRLGHVRYSLSALALFVCDRAKAGEREQWCRLFSTLRRLYRTEEERQIFTMMVDGASAEQAREHIHQTTLTLRTDAAGEVEIF